MKNETQILAAQLLAQLLTQEEKTQSGNRDNNKVLSTVLTRLDEMNSRLVQLESKITTPQIPNSNKVQISHPSREKFALEEAFDSNLKEEKACRFEPGGKPCDYCAMCSSRGF